MAQGGDTDTNLCIAGGLIGASVGEQGLPNDLLEKLKKSMPSNYFQIKNFVYMFLISPIKINLIILLFF